MLYMCFLGLLSLPFLLAACGASDFDNDAAGPDATPVPTTITIDITGANAGMDAGDHVLAWIGFGVSPAQPSGPGSLITVNGRGEAREVLVLPAGTNRVQPCGERATSPDGRYFTFFAGSDTGSLYLVDSAHEPTEIGPAGAMTCLGMGTFRYAPDSSRLGYINFPAEAASARYALGRLHIIETSSGEEQSNFNDVAAFDLSDNEAVFISFYPGSDDKVKEAAVSYWVEGSLREVVALFPAAACQYRDAQVVIVDEETSLVLLGQSCEGVPGGSWTLYSVDMAGHSAVQIVAGSDPGSYFSARANALLISPDGRTAYFTTPDGLRLETANLYSLSLVELEQQPPLISHVVMPRIVTSRPYDPGANSGPVLSSDGRWLAVVRSDANHTAVLHVLDLNVPDLPPIRIAAGSGQDTVSGMAFTADSQRLLFVAGGNDGGSNSLFSVDLETAADNRVIRGRFAGPILISPDGGAAALSDWQGDRSRYLNLNVVNLAQNQSIALFIGAEIVDNTVIDQRFIYPISWRR
jgi:Tol biopolymer transport system component